MDSHRNFSMTASIFNLFDELWYELVGFRYRNYVFAQFRYGSPVLMIIHDQKQFPNWETPGQILRLRLVIWAAVRWIGSFYTNLYKFWHLSKSKLFFNDLFNRANSTNPFFNFALANFLPNLKKLSKSTSNITKMTSDIAQNDPIMSPSQ